MYGIQIDIHQINTFHFYGYVVFLISFQAYDQHLNMILSEVEETITTVEIDEETYEELFKVKKLMIYSEQNLTIDWKLQYCTKLLE